MKELVWYVCYGSKNGGSPTANKLLFHARNDMKNAMIGNLAVFETLYWGNFLEMPMVILSFALAVGACIYLEPLMFLIIVVMGVLTAVAVKMTGSSLGMKYGEDKIIKNFSQTFESGKKYLIEGESGSGKSTILNLLCGLYRDCSRFFIGHSKPCESECFSFFITIYGDYTDDKVNAAVKQCGLDKLISSLENGLETMVTENGSNFSGGEKQRINIARALLKETPIMLFDEVTANLDPATTEFMSV